MTATGTGAGELRERLALALGQAIGLSPEREIEWMPVTLKQADTAIAVLAPAGGTVTAAIDAVCSWVEGDLDSARDGWMDGGSYSNDAEMRAHIATLKAIMERGTVTTPKECPECKGVGFIPEYEADPGYRMGYHQIGESRCGRCGGDGVIMEPDD